MSHIPHDNTIKKAIKTHSGDESDTLAAAQISGCRLFFDTEKEE